MTIEDLVRLSADKLEKLSDEDLIKILSPYFNVTRPEMAPKSAPQKVEPMIQLSAQKRAALALLQEDGVDISFLTRKRK